MFNKNPLWTLEYSEFVPEKEKHTEALCTTGNGYMGTRGAFEEMNSSDTHYPGTYIAGVYNRLSSNVNGREIENEDLVNCPDWTFITFRTPKGAWFSPGDGKILEYRKQLDLYSGILNREIRFKHNTGEITLIRSRRFISMADPHLAGLSYTVTPENYSGTIKFRSGLNGAHINDGVERYSQLNQLHLKSDTEEAEGPSLFLSVKTTQSEITVAQCAKHRILQNGNEISPDFSPQTDERAVFTEFETEAETGDDICTVKTAAVFTSLDKDTDNPLESAKEALAGRHTFENLFSKSSAVWEKVWQEIDIEIEGDENTQRIIRIHSFHMMVSASEFNTQIDASVPARGLHGEAYRGHIFWDELFILPFYAKHFPDISRALVMYRYRRLDAARKYAEEHGCRGAMFPWQSGTSGGEETQTLHLNPVSGEWGDDYSSLQRHVSLGIAWNVWYYYHLSGDIDFLRKYGAEMLLETARFWVSKCSLNRKTDKYEIHKVMGPNEYHEKMPGSSKGGLKDNAYINIMAVWVIKRAFESLELIGPGTSASLKAGLSLTDKELAEWKRVTENMNIGVRDGIISQYDGFLDLKELDWDHYRKKYGNIGRMDRILKAEGRSPDDYKLSKQADLLMTFYMLPVSEVKSILSGLGYDLDRNMLRKNYDYYLSKTSHGSTLSLVVHSHVAALLGDIDTSLEWYDRSLNADIDDIQGGTTKEGIHAGLMAGTVNNLLASYAGLELFGKRPALDPSLPERWKSLKFSFRFKKDLYNVTINHNEVAVCVFCGDNDYAEIDIFGEKVRILSNERKTIGAKG